MRGIRGGQTTKMYGTNRISQAPCALMIARHTLSRRCVAERTPVGASVPLGLKRRDQLRSKRANTACLSTSIGSEGLQDSENIPPSPKAFGQIENVLQEDVDRAKEYMNSKRKIYLPILRLNKAGIVLKFSEATEAFVPVAQLSTYTRQFYRDEWQRQFNHTERLSAGENPVSLLGQSLEVLVLNVRDERAAFEERHIIIVSEREVILKEAEAAYEETDIGDIVECYVKTITYFGLFVKMGAIDALIHKSQVWIPEMEEQGEDIVIDEEKLSTSFSLGDRLKAVVIKKNPEKMQVSLSMKELVPNRGKLTLSQVAEEMNNTNRLNSTCDIPEFLQLCSILDKMDEVNEIIPGPCIKSGAIAPEFQVLLSSKEIDGGYEVFARKGFHVQEAQIRTDLLRNDLKQMLQDVSKQVA